MIQIVYGDLLESDCHIIAHNCNCFSTMGAGIADEIKKKYPAVYEADKNFPHQPKERLGKYSFANVGHKVIFNLYGQLEYGRDKANFDNRAFTYALLGMLEHVDKIEKDSGKAFKIGLPHGIGAGLSQGDWVKIEKIIMMLSAKFNKTIFLYLLEK